MIPEDVLAYWIGHAVGNVTDRYSKLSKDIEFRQMLREKVGLGFSLNG
jgi:hypothetical protein